MNTKNTAVKRINADVKEIEKHATWRYHASPLEDDIFEWHFTIRGPPGSDFEGGIYHGRILLSSEYPFKPPNIIFLTKNGRFEVGTKICLSISAYHPEHWQPAWGVRTMLEAIVSFLPSEGHGAIGALDWTPKERARLAKESHKYVCPHCGPIDNLIPTPMPVPGQEEDQKESSSSEQSRKSDEDDMTARIAQMHVHGLGDSTPSKKTSADDQRSIPSVSANKSANESNNTFDQNHGGISNEFDPRRLASSIPDDPVALRDWLTSTKGVEMFSGDRKDFFEKHCRQLKMDEEEEEKERAGSWIDDVIFYTLILLIGAIVYLLMKRYQLYSSQNNPHAYRDL